jgi:hypothetical protein
MTGYDAGLDPQWVAPGIFSLSASDPSSLGVRPSVLGDRCPLDSDDEPSWKLLDAAHPDAVSPILEVDPAASEGKGWVSFQVTDSPTCAWTAEAVVTMHTASGEAVRVDRSDLGHAGANVDDTLPPPSTMSVGIPIVSALHESEIGSIDGDDFEPKRMGPVPIAAEDYVVDWSVEPGPNGCAIETLVADGSGGEDAFPFLRASAHEDIREVQSGRDSLARAFKVMNVGVGDRTTFILEVYATCPWTAELLAVPPE